MWVLYPGSEKINCLRSLGCSGYETLIVLPHLSGPTGVLLELFKKIIFVFGFYVSQFVLYA